MSEYQDTKLDRRQRIRLKRRGHRVDQSFVRTLREMWEKARSRQMRENRHIAK